MGISHFKCTHFKFIWMDALPKKHGDEIMWCELWMYTSDFFFLSSTKNDYFKCIKVTINLKKITTNMKPLSKSSNDKYYRNYFFWCREYWSNLLLLNKSNFSMEIKTNVDHRSINARVHISGEMREKRT